MNFIKTNNPVLDSAHLVTQEISARLDKNQSVLWLLSGGSSTKVALKVAELLRGHNLEYLSVSMTDERYGKIGHDHENWQQLLNAGLELDGANLYRPLINADRQTTSEAFGNWLRSQLASCDYSIGIFGIGADGHTAGIKPGSSAAKSVDIVADYEASDYERITITFPVIQCLNQIVIQAAGNDKLATLKQFEQVNHDLSDFPAAIFQSLPNVNIYSDQSDIKPVSMLG